MIAEVECLCDLITRKYQAGERKGVKGAELKLKKSTRKRVIRLAAILLLVLPGTTGISSTSPGVLYVSSIPAGSGDCSDWNNACDLSTALSVATSANEIWMARGFYIPGFTIDDTFQLKDGVVLFERYTRHPPI
jgi:hypothetical protein